jgi:NitT/TauT family transport system substrate-binding protein
MPSAASGLGLPPTNRRETLRRLALAGLSGATPLGIGTLWWRALQEGGAETTAGFTPLSHQLGWVKGVQFGGDFMAEAQGYLKRERLDVAFAPGGPGTDYRTLVASGRMMVSESNVNGMIDSVVQGQPLVAFAAVMQRDPSAFMSSPERPIRSLEDMVGKTIGVPGSIRGQLSELMRRRNLDPSSVRFVPVGTDSRMLLAGQIDGYFSWATTAAPGLRRAGFDPHILHLSEIGSPGYGGVLFTRQDLLERQFELFVRYTRALVRGWGWMVQNPEETARIVVERYAPPGTDLGEQTDQAKMMTDYIDTGDARTEGLLWLKPEVFEQGLRLSYDAGVIPRSQKVDIGKLVDQRVIRAALGKA